MTPAQHNGAGYRLIVCAITAAALLIAGCSKSDSGSAQSGATGESSIGGLFRLTDTRGRTVTDETLRGKAFAIFFGFTRCPDVCPTTLNRMSELHRRLGADADKLNIVFVSVDPEHDKREDIASYLTLFPAPVTGLTGTTAELKQIQNAFRVYAHKVPLPGGDYTVDHTAFVYLMDANGRFFEPMSASEPIEANLGQIRKLIAS